MRNKMSLSKAEARLLARMIKENIYTPVITKHDMQQAYKNIQKESRLTK